MVIDFPIQLTKQKRCGELFQKLSILTLCRILKSDKSQNINKSGKRYLTHCTNVFSYHKELFYFNKDVETSTIFDKMDF